MSTDTNFLVAVTDLNTIFAPYTSGTPARTTDFLVNGTDLNNIFAPYTSGTKAITTNFLVAGTDLNAIFQPLPTGIIPATEPTTSFLYWYKLNAGDITGSTLTNYGTATDVTVGSGQITGTVGTSSSIVKFYNSSLYFSGATTNWIMMPTFTVATPTTAGQGYTFNFWVYPTVYSGNNAVCQMGQNINAATLQYVVGSGTASVIYIGSTSYTTTFKPPLNTWSMVTITIQYNTNITGGSIGTIYYNGSQNIQNTASNYLTVGTYTTNYLGRQSGGNYLNGYLNNVMLANTVLTPTQIASLYSSGTY